jgi:hypothetical protein
MKLTLSTRVLVVNGVALLLVIFVGLFVSRQFEKHRDLAVQLELQHTAMHQHLQMEIRRAAIDAEIGGTFAGVSSEAAPDETSANAKGSLESLQLHLAKIRESIAQSGRGISIDRFAQAAGEAVRVKGAGDTQKARVLQAEYWKASDDLRKRLRSMLERDFHEIEDLHLKNKELERSSSSLLVYLTVVSLSVLLVVSVVFVRTITRPLNVVIESLKTGAEQFAASANLVSSAGQQLAMSASQQAASLEEASASLEEIAGMTRHSADNAQKTSELVGQTRSAMEVSMRDIREMNTAMDAIKSSSDSISKIIKTIDEISFQTNILALNAAVEAARAGEAGLGFAVVADEVRNLAQHSAKAAHDTAEKIEDSIKKSEQAVRASAKVSTNLDKVIGDVRQVDELVAEISSASKEQNLGLEQINVAVNQIDQGTQSTAANAEESASAAEELNAQALELESAVKELLHLVGKPKDSAREAQGDSEDQGGRKGGLRSGTGSAVVSNAFKSRIRPVRSNLKDDPRVSRIEKGGAAKLLGRNSKSRAEQEIPMDQHFKEF